MSRMRKDSWSDAAILEALRLRDLEGVSQAEIGRRLGATKNAVAAAFHRVRHAEVPGRAGNGTMPDEWWRAGLARRKGGAGHG